MRQETVDPVLFVLLGASNLSRAYYGLIKHLERCLHPRPVRFLNALGPGRAYCAEGGLLNIVYPPIGTCGILTEARKSSAGRVVALVTDIGSDIMYDVPAEKITADLTGVFEKLHEMDAAILATSVPRYLEEELDDFYFRCLRAVFYPRSRVERRQVASAVREINRFLQTSSQVTLISGLEDCYGIDRIHFSPIKMHLAWTRIAGAILRVLQVVPKEGMGWPEMFCSLGAQAFRLVLSDMAAIRDKDPGFF